MNQFRVILDTYFKGDKIIWSILFALSLASMLAVYSASGYVTFRGGGGVAETYLLKHIFYLVLGYAMAYFAYKIHYLYYSQWAPYLFSIAIVMMFYTTFFGVEINDARRWMNIPILNYSFQTSDFARVALVLLVARTLARKQSVIKRWKNAFLPIIGSIILMCMLIAPADLSTSALLFATCVTMMFVGRVSLKYIGLLFIAGAIALAVIVAIGNVFPDFIRIETWTSRIDEFLYGIGTEYQVQQSKIAIASGGLFGQGIGDSLQRNHLPYAYADFIYAIICEEYGIVGGLAVILCYFGLLWRSMRIVSRCKKAFATLLAIGLCLNLVIQAYANIAVSVNLLPVTGLTLPLISMGGTSLMFTCISFGIILSVSRYVEEERAKTLANKLKTIKEDTESTLEVETEIVKE